MDKSNVLDIYELTPMQKGMLFHAIRDGRDNFYFVQGSAILEGTVDRCVLESSFQAMIDKYDVLRTAFVHENLQQPVQIVLKKREVSLQYEDITHLSAEEQTHFLAEYKEADREKPFQLAKDPLIRLHLIKLSSDRYELIWNFHHIVMDGWCWGLVFEDLLETYGRLLNRQQPAPGQPPKYSSYMKWLQRQDAKESAAFWSDYLSGYEEAAVIPRQQKRQGSEYLHREHIFRLSKETTFRLAQLAKELQTTLNNVIQTAWAILLYKYNRADDVVFGSVVSGRPPELERVQDIVGLFINTIPVRVKKEPGQTFSSLVASVHRSSLAAKPYEYSSLADIQANSECGGQLVNHIVVFENYVSSLDSVRELSSRLGFTFRQGDSVERNNYDFSLIIQPGEELEFNMTYNQEAYTPDFIERLSGHLRNIVEAVAADRDIEVDRIDIVDDAERRELLAFNPPAADYPRQQTINGLFGEQARRTPDRIAVVHGAESLTYQQLDEAANRLAREILAQGAKRESIVGILLDRSADMIIAILAALKAGTTYLPIDPAYPAERIQYMLEDSGAELLLAASGQTAPNSYRGAVISLDGDFWKSGDSSSLEELNRPDSRAYIIYTSGSTGKPKGVMVEHKNVVRLLFNSDNLFDFNENDVWTMFHSMCFDFSVWEMYGALLYGGKLVIVPADTARDAREFRALLRSEGVTILNQTPSAFNMLASEEAAHEDHLNIRKVIFGGEALSPIQLKAWHEKYPSTALINMYGITETTVHVTYKEITKREIDSNVSNIGRAIPTLQAYVLDERQQLLPIGVPGELYVSGDGVALGYLNRAELTAERFIENPFAPGERMYRSGDLVKWLPGGEMEYLGRIDHQVKIRGHRIELEEVSAQLLLHEHIRDGIVLARSDGDGIPYLCAYFVASQTIHTDSLREYMSERLPQYMVPSFFIELDRLPMTPNGKIRRDALPSPADIRKSATEYAAPQSELELALLGIYQDVLGMADLGVTDHFLRLGGHSLKATMLVSKIRKALGANVPVSEVFSNPTVRDLARYIRSEEGLPEMKIIHPAPELPQYPVTSQQKRLYSIQELDPSGVSYNIPVALEITGALDIPKLEQSLQRLADRHESLRTLLRAEDGRLVQYVADRVETRLALLAAAPDPAELERIMMEFIRPFELDKAPLFRAGLVQAGPERHILLLDVHHIISDGLSMNILLHDLFHFYQDKALPVIQVQYKDYAVWQERWAGSPEYAKQEQFWVSRFAGELPILDFPTDYARPPVQTFAGDQLGFEVDKASTEELKSLAVQQQATLFMALLAVYHILLAKYSGQRDVIVGTPLSGRPSEQLDYTTGMFANVVPLRNPLSFDQTFSEYLQNVRNELLKVYQHGDYPLEELVKRLSLQRDPSRNPLFDTLFTLQDIEEVDIDAGGLKLRELRLGEPAAKFDMTWEIVTGEKLFIHLCYNTSLFQRATMERLAGHFKSIVAQVLRNPQIAIKDILLATPEEEQILQSFNAARGTTEHRHSTIVGLFENQARLNPDDTALFWREQSLSYRELNSKANQIANILRRKGVGRNQIVGIMLPPSPEMIIVMLGILKAGGAYLPIDPTYPAERIHHFLSDSGAGLLFTREGMEDRVVAGQQELLLVEDLAFEEEECPNPEHAAAPDDLAYVIYTSGSTGKPKGVMIRHHSVCNLSLVSDTLGIQRGSRVLQFSSFSFDASVWEIFMTLLRGATLYIEDRNVLLEQGLGSWLKAKRINVATLLPSVLRSIPYEELPDLHTLVTGGEACTMDLIEKWAEGRTLINAYGPTEATVCSTLTPVSRSTKRITIGKPIKNTEAYILNSYRQLQPVGVPGELCIGGAGLAKGYLNRPELTAEKFIDNPFQPGTQLYRTGDLARWLPNGEIEYLGRMDHQVKIRGYRIELEEISDCLLRHESVREAVVVPVQQGGTTALAAYYVAVGPIGASELRRHLSEELPEYMIPAYFTPLEQMPLTANGKVDAKRLPKPQLGSREKIAPRNAQEEQLLKVWQEVLAVDEIGVEDNFFELGGDSIKAIEISAKLNRSSLRFRIKDIFESPTIAGLSAKLVKQSSGASTAAVEGRVPLTPVQQWVFQLAGHPEHWNQAIMLEREDSWNVDAVTAAFQSITEHHDALRMIYYPDDHGMIQENQSASGRHFDLECFDFQGRADAESLIEREADRLQRSIRLEQGPLTKLGVFRTDAGSYLLIIIHHLVVDAVSWRIIMEDFEYLYGCYEHGETPQLPAKTTSFQAWSEALARYANTADVLEEAEYWSSVISKEVPGLPAGQNAGTSHTFGDMEEIEVDLTAEETGILVRRAPAAWGTEMNDLLIAAYLRTLNEWCGHTRFAIDLEGHGRSEFSPDQDLTRTVGWFTSLYPAVYEIPEGNLLSVLKTVRENHRSIPRKGFGYSILKFLTDPERKEGIDFGFAPEICFNYLGEFQDGLKQEGVRSASIPFGDLIDHSMIWPYQMELNAHIVNGQLRCALRFNRRRIARGSMDMLASRFRHHLVLLSEHCSEEDLLRI
ncbi:non-ribosomal peptide synthetase [Paenibacillus ihumii]|uniref:non-ribosomal peptide synthetase n=1 Tax=Paenibacillus ihumii TaxID=687436 RepID=UPI00093AF14B|nr:non-ribosomal peptide synthetase [Paenibacillus ihumii]